MKWQAFSKVTYRHIPGSKVVITNCSNWQSQAHSTGLTLCHDQLQSSARYAFASTTKDRSGTPEAVCPDDRRFTSNAADSQMRAAPSNADHQIDGQASESVQVRYGQRKRNFAVRCLYAQKLKTLGRYS